MSLFRRPVRRTASGYVIAVRPEEAALIARLAGELRELLTADGIDPARDELLARLFPTAYPDDEELEAEYQRLMREELVASRLAALDVVERALDTSANDRTLDDVGFAAFMQSVNSIRLILGTMLAVSDDPEADEVVAGLEASPEYALYSYLSWLLDQCVNVASS